MRHLGLKKNHIELVLYFVIALFSLLLYTDQLIMILHNFIFTDANTFVNKEAVRNMIRHYADPKVGVIAGEKRIEVTRGSKSPR